MTSIEEYLNENGTLTYSNVGTSMIPLLHQGRDLFVVRAKHPGERFKVGDVVLYKRPPEQHVLHRVVEVLPDMYIILGDNCVRREVEIPDSDILGVMTGFVRDGKEHSVNERAYRLYTTWILKAERPRIVCKKLWIKAKRVINRLVGR